MDFYKLLLEDTDCKLEDYRNILKEKSINDIDFSKFTVKKFMIKMHNL